MTAFISLCLLAVALVALILAAFYALEVMLAFWGAGRSRTGAGGSLAILVPAHDEEPVIGATLASILAAKRPEDRIVVIADNCTDATADTARRSGVDVLVRTDTERRGKGYALQFGIESLRAAPPEGVVVIDADCKVQGGAFEHIAASMAATGRPAQMLYMMHAPQAAPPSRRIGAFAWLLMNKVRMRGLQRLAGGSRFTGAGMALPWAIAEKVDLASGEIVEDISLYAKLVREGAAPVLVEDAIVESEFPVASEGVVTQRARWENGSLRLAVSIAPKLLVRGLMKGDLRLACAALDLAVPPMVLFGVLIVATATASFIPLVWGDAAPLIVSLAAGTLFAAATMAAWAGFGREALPLKDLAAAGSYLADKVSVYFGKGRRSARTWTRTTRDAAAPEKETGA